MFSTQPAPSSQAGPTAIRLFGDYKEKPIPLPLLQKVAAQAERFCRLCDKTIPESCRSLFSHMKTVHLQQEPQLTCAIFGCKQSFKRTFQYSRHIKEMHAKDHMKCGYCDLVIKRNAELYRHFKTRHFNALAEASKKHNKLSATIDPETGVWIYKVSDPKFLRKPTQPPKSIKEQKARKKSSSAAPKQSSRFNSGPLQMPPKAGVLAPPSSNFLASPLTQVQTEGAASGWVQFSPPYGVVSGWGQFSPSYGVAPGWVQFPPPHGLVHGWGQFPIYYDPVHSQPEAAALPPPEPAAIYYPDAPKLVDPISISRLSKSWCHECGQDIQGDTLSNHMRGLHPGCTFLCIFPDCSENFSSIPKRNEHTEIVHLPKSHHCTLCNFATRTQGTLHSHMRNRHESDPAVLKWKTQPIKSPLLRIVHTDGINKYYDFNRSS